MAADSVSSELEDRFKAAKLVRRTFERQWLLNVAMALGQQWITVDSAGLVSPAIGDGDRVTLTDNRIRGNVRSSVAKQTKTDPVWTGVPRNASDEEVARARLRTSAFEHYWRELQARRRLRLALWWRETCGIGWWKLTWDRTAGQRTNVLALRGGPVITNAQGGPASLADIAAQQLPPEVSERIEQRAVTFGNLDLRVKTPWEVAVDPLATSEGLVTAEYVVEEGIYSPAYLERAFGADRDRLDNNAELSAGVLESRFPALTRFMDSSHRGAPGRRGVRVREYWSLPGLDDPAGRHCVYTASDMELLLEEALLYPFLPYIDFRGLMAGRFHPDAPVTDQVSPQTELNKTTSQIAENAERFGNPARLRSSESIDQRSGEWQGLPGEEVIYHDLGTPGSIPSFLQPPEMPAYVQNRIPQIIESLNAISGNGEVAQGTVPEGVTAASAISQLLEANDTMIGLDMGDMTDSLLDAGKKLLWILQRYASNERLLRVAGEDAAWDVYTFRGQELGDPDADEVDIGSGLPESKAQKQAAIQFILNLLIQNGQAPEPRELRRILRDYEVGGLEHFFASISKDQSQIAEEHRRFLQGENFPTNFYDDDQVHVEEHFDWFKSARFRELAGTPRGQMIQQNAIAHAQEHVQKLQGAATEQAMAEAAQSALESGQPGPEPSTGDPAGQEATGSTEGPPAPPAPPDALPLAQGAPSPSTGGSA